MPITPDDKNWTWVLERDCPDCGFQTQSWPREQVGALIRANATKWPDLLATPDAARRPTDSQWSALEYGCHVRDVLRLYHYRLGLMIEQDGPHFPNWDQDVTAVEDRYHEQDPAAVATDIVAAADELAAAFDTIEGDQWTRTGYRSDGAAFTIESFARYFMHDPEHHLADVARGNQILRPEASQ